MLSPDHQHQCDADTEEQRQDQQQALRPKVASRGVRYEAPENTAQDPPAADQAEHALGLACGQHEVGQSPHLRDGQYTEDTDPDVECGEEPVPPETAERPPEENRDAREGDQAPCQQVVQSDPMTRTDVGCDDEAHQHGDGYVDVRKLVWVKAIQEESITGDLADHVARDDQEVIGEEEEAAREVTAAQAQQSFKPVRHESREALTGGGI